MLVFSDDVAAFQSAMTLERAFVCAQFAVVALQIAKLVCSMVSAARPSRPLRVPHMKRKRACGVSNVHERRRS